MMNIEIGGDPNTAGLRKVVTDHLRHQSNTCVDVGSEDVICANVAIAAAEAVTSGKYDLGMLICETGIGMSIAANKAPGACAAAWLAAEYVSDTGSETKMSGSSTMPVPMKNSSRLLSLKLFFSSQLAPAMPSFPANDRHLG